MTDFIYGKCDTADVLSASVSLLIPSQGQATWSTRHMPDVSSMSNSPSQLNADTPLQDTLPAKA